MTRILLSVALMCIAPLLTAKEAPRYPVSQIPEELRKGAHAVVREDKMHFAIESSSNAKLYVTFVVTIFNENAKHFAKRAIGYDKLRKINSIKAQAYDETGALIKRLKPSEISDHSAYEGLYSDNRARYVDLAQGRYPYTVEIEYEIAYKFLYYIDGSVIDGLEDVAVQNAEYKLTYPEHLRPRYRTTNVSTEPVKTVDNGKTSLTWTFKDLPPKKYEPYSDLMNSIVSIDAAPGVFEFEGYAGKMNSWDEYGQWINLLNKGRNVLPDETKQKIQEITAGLKTREDKIRAVYEYMQNKTRYVSIQLGIGGYQPFEASVVDKTGYGDCKALSNYMLAMLETIGIKGNYVLINAGDRKQELITDFPSSQFNHAIVAVPNGSDTIWLECTSQTAPFGYQGKFTGDRKALMITDNGAAVVNTTRYPADVNLQITNADVSLDLKGSANAKVKRSYTGLQFENSNLDFIVHKQTDDQKKWVQNNLSVPSFDLASFKMSHQKEKIPSAVVDAELAIDRFASVSGKRIFFTPNLMNRNSFIPEKDDKRTSDIVWGMGYVDVDTIRYKLPDEVYPEFVPENVKIQSRFGSYEASFAIDQGGLVYIRKIKINKGTFPASSYQEMTDFYRSVSKADNIKMVFMSKT